MRSALRAFMGDVLAGVVFVAFIGSGWAFMAVIQAYRGVL